MSSFNIDDVKKLVCGPLPLVAALGVFCDQNGHKQYFNHQDPKAWPSHSNVTYCFVDPNGASLLQEGLVKDSIKNYTDHANITLVEVKDAASAMIRISFMDTERAWSAIGIDALKILTGPTMNLGFIPEELSSYDDTENTHKLLKKLTLHELGHAFGLAHEWNGDKTLCSKGDHKDAINQHLKAFGDEKTSNFPKSDGKSIMHFFVPEDSIALSEALSDKDKAWLTLMYPGKAASAGGDDDAGVLKSLNVLGVDLKVTTQILLSGTVSEMRSHYLDYISKEHKDRLGLQLIKDAISDLTEKILDPSNVPPEPHVLQGKVTGMTPLVDHNNEDDLYDTVAAAVLNPQFHQVLANVVNQPEEGQPQDAQHVIYTPGRGNSFRDWLIVSGIPSRMPNGAPSVSNYIQPFPRFSTPHIPPYLIDGIPVGTAAAIYSQLPPEVQMGFFGAIRDIIASAKDLKKIFT